MAAMPRDLMLRTILGALVAIGALASDRAQAQYYDLDGSYRCLTVPSAACKASEQPPPPLPPPPPPTPSVAEAIGHIREQRVTADDIDALTKQTAAKEPRAVEALAWCKLNGMGMASDPVEAFFLYGEAADLGIPTARSNQIAIFETRLSPEQRQLVLMRVQAP